MTNKEIGERLGISERGVKYHVSRLFVLYDVESRAELIAIVLRRRQWIGYTYEGFQTKRVELRSSTSRGLACEQQTGRWSTQNTSLMCDPGEAF